MKRTLRITAWICALATVISLCACACAAGGTYRGAYALSDGTGAMNKDAFPRNRNIMQSNASDAGMPLEAAHEEGLKTKSLYGKNDILGLDRARELNHSAGIGSLMGEARRITPTAFRKLHPAQAGDMSLSACFTNDSTALTSLPSLRQAYNPSGD